MNSLNNFNMFMNYKREFDKNLSIIEESINGYQYPLLSKAAKAEIEARKRANGQLQDENTEVMDDSGASQIVFPNEDSMAVAPEQTKETALEEVGGKQNLQGH